MRRRIAMMILATSMMAECMSGVPVSADTKDAHIAKLEAQVMDLQKQLTEVNTKKPDEKVAATGVVTNKKKAAKGKTGWDSDSDSEKV